MVSELEESDGFDLVRGRAYTWAHQERKSTVPSAGSWEALTAEDFQRNGGQSGDSPFDSEDTPLQQKAQMVAGKKRRKSYTEMIATAILTSPERRLTLAEIYDWMTANIEEYKNQRYVPSSSSWKNAVRHNLSVQSCFKRVKRHGVEKPSWWTVDVRQAAKRRLSVPFITGSKVGLEPEPRGTRRHSHAAAVSKVSPKGTGLGLGDCTDDAEGVGEADEHAYSRNTEQLKEDQSSGMEFDSLVAYDGNNQKVGILNVDTGSSIPMSTDQLAQAWLDQFKTSGTGVAIGKDGSAVQTLRVKTVHGVEQNVRFVGPLRVNVVVHCEKATQTDDSEVNSGLPKLENGTEANANFPPRQDFEGLSRTCGIDQTLVSLGNDSTCGVAEILHSDVKMPSTMNVLSPAAVLEENALTACWNAINGDDLMTLTNMA